MRIIDEQGLLSPPVVNGQEFMKTKIDTIGENTRIEEAAAMFITSKVRFIPITNDKNIVS